MSKPRLTLSTPIIILSAVYLAVILAPLEYSSRLWGINHLVYFGWDTRITVVGISLLVPLLLFGIVSKIPGRRKISWFLLHLGVPLLLLALFYLLRMSTHFLGDGILRARELEVGIWYLPTEPLGVLVNFLTYGLTSRWCGFGAIEAIEVVSFIGGILFYFVALSFARYRFKERQEQLLAFMLLFFSGTTLLFCGYVETYSLLPAVIAIYLVTGIKAIERSGSPLRPLILYLLALLLHFASIYLAPGLLVLAYFYYRQNRPARVIAALGTILSSVAIVIILPSVSERATLSIGGFLIPLVPGEETYWLLSGQHLLDIGNQLLLTAVPALILLVSLLIYRRRVGLAWDWHLAFLVAALPGAIAFICLLDPKLGYASDWDLFASTGVVLSLLVLSIYAATEQVQLSRLGKTLLSAAALACFLSYAVVNSDYEQSIERQVEILSIYGERGGTGFETMGNHLNQEDKTELAERMWKKAAALLPHRRTYSNLGQLMLDQGRLTEARFYIEKGLALDSNYAPLHAILGSIYIEEGQFADAQQRLQRALRLSPEDARIHYNLSRCLASLGQYAEAEKCARQAVSRTPDKARFYCGLGIILAAQGKAKEAKESFLTAVRLDPAMAEPHLNLARFSAAKGEYAEAIQILQRYLRSYPRSPSRAKVELLLEEIQEIQEKQEK
ncbi:MAG: tetratricopeptide repeat protein [candidate division Zixibacteria bacterium]|nr:tetratricopeptide repeat protein [candidate division Zixibacteria bacterium]